MSLNDHEDGWDSKLIIAGRGLDQLHNGICDGCWQVMLGAVPLGDNLQRKELKMVLKFINNGNNQLIKVNSFVCNARCLPVNPNFICTLGK